MYGVGVLVLGVVCTFALANSLAVDNVLTNDLEDVIKNEEFVITLRHLKPRRRHRLTSETLFAVDFLNSDNKFSVLLDRTEKNVVVDTIEDGRKREQHFTVDTLESDTIIRSLILAFDQKQPGAKISLYVDCVAYGMVATPKTMRDMYTKMASPAFQMMRERKYHMEIERDTIKKILLYNNCSIDVANMHSKRNLDLFLNASPSFLNELADEPRNLQPLEAFIPSGRGDIPLPLLPEVDDCTVIIKAINQLTIAVNRLGEKIDRNSELIVGVDKYLQDCNLCPNEQLASCRSHPPNCYPGVSCMDTMQGPRCGNCPPGYTGDGINCEKIRITCAEKHCAPHVQCHELASGAICGSCPAGYTGNGEYCERATITCAQKQCAALVQCYETSDGARCGPCPAGYTGNGEHCEKDRITCAEKQCAAYVQCYESSDGARCGPCPAGYTGDGEYCEKTRITCAEKQCASNVHCYDRPDGAICGPCPAGYTGDGERCEPEYTCESHPCFAGVHCRETAGGPECSDCPSGYYGDGRDCKLGYKCKDRPCYQGVSCYDTDHGAKCGDCPHGYEGDGFRCRPVQQETCRNYNPCYHGVQCYDTASGPSCGSCPHGMVGDGFRCRYKLCSDQPCYRGASCEDTPSGPKCGPCPAGWTGDGIQCRRICDYRPCGNGELHCCPFQTKK